jgi:hypothetical protein
MDSRTALAVLEDVFLKYGREENTRLVKKVHAEWDKDPPEFTLADGLVAKRFDGKRVRRVIWKIVRGLHYYEHEVILPEWMPFHITHRWPGTLFPEQYMHLDVTPYLGKHPEVFAYRYRIFDTPSMQYWALYLWNRIVFLVAFHDISCGCDECSSCERLSKTCGDKYSRF